jgi:hypothetical protein
VQDPGLQGLQEVAANPELNEPGGHIEQLAEPGVLEKLPGEQLEQVEAPLALKYPEEQLVHAGAP